MFSYKTKEILEKLEESVDSAGNILDYIQNTIGTRYNMSSKWLI